MYFSYSCSIELGWVHVVKEMVRCAEFDLVHQSQQEGRSLASLLAPFSSSHSSSSNASLSGRKLAVIVSCRMEGILRSRCSGAGPTEKEQLCCAHLFLSSPSLDVLSIIACDDRGMSNRGNFVLIHHVAARVTTTCGEALALKFCNALPSE